jgi:hypothetical protein
MGITIETRQVTAEWKYRVRRIEIIAENDTPMLDRTILLEVEEVSVVDGITISHKFVKNVQRKLGDLVDLVDPYGTTAMQSITMLLWDNDVQAQAVSDAMMIPLATPAMVDVGGISGEFSEVKITQLQISDSGVYLGVIPGNAALLSNRGQMAEYSSMRPETVEAIRTAVRLIGEEWSLGIVV